MKSLRSSFKIGERTIGSGSTAFIIAELSGNHNGSFERATALVDAAIASGADAVKVQTYTADSMTVQADGGAFSLEGTIWAGRTLHDLYREASMPWEWQPKLAALCRDRGVPFFSTPFDETSVEFLHGMGVPCWKIASFEATDVPLLRRVAATGLPVILSTGMATRAEVERAVTELRTHGTDSVALLKCTSAYPAPASSLNLRTMRDMAERYGCPVGLSDHTLESTACVASIALGASVIEKHMTLRRADGGPDAAFSLEPAEFAAMVAAVRTAEAALGSVQYGTSEADKGSLKYRRAMFLRHALNKGARIAAADLVMLRPAAGIAPTFIDDVLGSTMARDGKAGEPLTTDMVAWKNGVPPACA